MRPARQPATGCLVGEDQLLQYVGLDRELIRPTSHEVEIALYPLRTQRLDAIVTPTFCRSQLDTMSSRISARAPSGDTK